MQLIPSLLLLLAGAHLLGRLSIRFKQPALAGHMIAGILIGPSLLGWLKPNTVLSVASDIAVLFVVLDAGLEMRLQHLTAVFRGRGVLTMLVGFLLPAALGGAVAAAFSIAAIPALVVAVCVAVTALPIALQILGNFGLLHSRIGHISIAGALLSDILVFMILGVVIQVTVSDATQGAGLSIALACAKLAGLIASVVAAQWVCVRIIKLRRNSQSHTAPVANLTFAVLFVLALGAMSELLGFHFAIGAFFAAMMITPEVIGEHSFDRLENTCESLTASLFGPLFLAYQGLQFHLQTLTKPGFVVTLTFAAIIGKLLSGYIVGRLQRMSHRDATAVGIVMNARGVMELVIASIAFRAGLIDIEIFSVLLAVGLVTTTLTPLLLQRWQTAGTASPAKSAHIL